MDTHQAELERIVLTAPLAGDPAVAERMLELTPEHFRPGPHRILMGVYHALLNAGQAINWTNIIAELERQHAYERFGGTEKLGEFSQHFASPTELDSSIEAVKDIATKRHLYQVGAWLAQQSQNGRAAAEIAEEAMTRLANTDTQAAQLKTAADGALSVLAKAEHYARYPLKEGETRGIDTGYTDLNHITGGWMRGTVGYVLGDEHIGKTTFCLNCALKLAQAGRRVLIFSLEMNADTNPEAVEKTTLWDRLTLMAAQVHMANYRSGRLTDEQLGRLNHAAQQMSTWDLQIVDNVFDYLAIAATCRREARLKPLDLIVVDYLKLVVPPERANSRNDELGILTRAFRSLAVTVDAPFLIPHQVGGKKLTDRSDKKPQLSDGYETGHLSQDADLVLSVYRDEVYHDNTETPNIMEVRTLKHRPLPELTGKSCQLFFDKQHGLLKTARRRYEYTS